MRSSLFAASLLLALTSPPTMAGDIACKVAGVHGGDTFTCLDSSKKQLTVRLAEIDTPESAQPYAIQSRQVLSDLISAKKVTLRVQDTDRDGRTVARVYVGNTNVNAQMVRRGAAWVFRQFSKDKALIHLEDQARAAKRGLWSLPESERMPPWEWRQAGSDQREESGESANLLASRSSNSESSLAGGAGSSSFSCDTHKRCSEISSCEEANFQQRECGNNLLDGNRDGVPCDSLCR
ncbi:MAG TPA: thermonuclease family protein [Polaromonas sp.]|nr:thermonuclease family protein [Polaromonas sp.]